VALSSWVSWKEHIDVVIFESDVESFSLYFEYLYCQNSYSAWQESGSSPRRGNWLEIMTRITQFVIHSYPTEA
jgi:hypothetical protein